MITAATTTLTTLWSPYRLEQFASSFPPLTPQAIPRCRRARALVVDLNNQVSIRQIATDAINNQVMQVTSSPVKCRLPGGPSPCISSHRPGDCHMSRPDRYHRCRTSSDTLLSRSCHRRCRSAGSGPSQVHSLPVPELDPVSQSPCEIIIAHAVHGAGITAQVVIVQCAVRVVCRGSSK